MFNGTGEGAAMMAVLVVLQFGSAIAAIIAASYWFLSAVRKPPIGRVIEGVSRLREEWTMASRFNSIAASAAGVSALLQAAAILVDLLAKP
jgi:hypothetical protein